MTAIIATIEYHLLLRTFLAIIIATIEYLLLLRTFLLPTDWDPYKLYFPSKCWKTTIVVIIKLKL